MGVSANQIMQTRFRTANGINIRYAESAGHQDSIILLTSTFPQSLFTFLPLWTLLSQHSHLLAIDLPGFGQSDLKNDLLSPQAMSTFLVQLIDEWGLNAPHIVAPDVGTAAALFAAAHHPSKIRSLIVGNGGTSNPIQVSGRLKDVIYAPHLEVLQAVDVQVSLPASIRNGHEHYQTPADVLADYIQSYAGGRYADACLYVRSYIGDLPVLEKLLPAIQTPVQIISSLRDKLVPPTNGEYLHARLPKNRLDFLDATHFAWEEVPGQYAAIISDWVEEGYQNV